MVIQSTHILLLFYQGFILGYGQWLLVIECFFFGAEEAPLIVSDINLKSLVGELIAFLKNENKPIKKKKPNASDLR